jgi:hypothetical protein
MADFRSVRGRSPAWHRTTGAFSNFEFIDSQFGSHPLLRAFFPRGKARFGGLLTERLAEAESPSSRPKTPRSPATAATSRARGQ